MIIPFKKLDLTIDPLPLQAALKEKSHLFDQITQRRDGCTSPHREMTDIWVRYQDMTDMEATKDYTGLCDEHDSIWLPPYYELPEIKNIVFPLMTAVNGERLGGIFITKLPPGGKIYPHVDGGWHAAYYDKYYVPIENYKGSVFEFVNGVIDPEMGDIYKFTNSVLHWVKNDTAHDRIAMIVCIKGDT